MRHFFRELFARVPDLPLPPNPWGGVQQPENFDPAPSEVTPEFPPSIYDGLIAGLEGDVIGLKSLLDYHGGQIETLKPTLQHKREQLAVLTAHREEERREGRDMPPLNLSSGALHFMPNDWKPGDPIPGCRCSRCIERLGQATFD